MWSLRSNAKNLKIEQSQRLMRAKVGIAREQSALKEIYVWSILSNYRAIIVSKAIIVFDGKLFADVLSRVLRKVFEGQRSQLYFLLSHLEAFTNAQKKLFTS